MGCKMKLEKYFLIGLVMMLVITAFMPQHIVLGDGASDELQISFDPTGSVDGNVSPEVCNFSTVAMSSNEETAFDFTLYNNGSIPMLATGQQNQSTDEGDMDCDGDGDPGEDFYSLRITDTALSGNNNYINDVAAETLELSLAGESSDTFKLTIYLGTCSADHDWQTTQVNWTFTAA